jgi:hypothetical protein
MGLEIDAKRGVANSYGVRNTTGQYGSQQSTKNGIVKSAIWEFTYNTLPDAGANNLQFVIPAGATIVSAKLVVDTAFTSTSTTTDLTVGLQTSAGVEIDNDGLVTAAEGTQTAIAVEGAVVTGAGALIGKTIGATAGELVVAGTVDDLLTGAGRVVVEYIYNS